MTDDSVIRDLARATGSKKDLTSTEVRFIRQKLVHSFIDDMLDAQSVVPVKEKDTETYFKKEET